MDPHGQHSTTTAARRKSPVGNATLDNDKTGKRRHEVKLERRDTISGQRAKENTMEITAADNFAVSAYGPRMHAGASLTPRRYTLPLPKTQCTTQSPADNATAERPKPL